MIEVGDTVEIRTGNVHYGLVRIKEMNPRILVVEYQRSKDFPRVHTDKHERVILEHGMDVVSWKDVKRIVKLIK